jgi:hypothetical protein
MKKIALLLAFSLFFTLFSYSSFFSGNTINSKTKKPVEYVNIGIVGKNIGTVADENGKYKIDLDSKYDNDTLRFSCIGYSSFSIKVADFKKLKSDILLEEKITEMKEVVIFPKVFKQKTLGVTATGKAIQAGFDTVKLGSEYGILMKIKKSAYLQKVNVNIARCSFDTMFYRLNIYKVVGKKQFENILKEPIYLKLPKEQTKKTVEIDLTKYNLVVQGSVLVSLEQVKDQGAGKLFFCVGLSESTYYRETSQGDWHSVPIGISISLDAKVEK